MKSMMRYSSRYVMFTFVMLMTAIVPAVAQNYFFRHYTINDGLTTMRISFDATIQDRRGFMWFGTTLGLNYFDGYRFRNDIPIHGDNSWLKSANITGIDEDKKGVIWIGCNKGVCSYDPITDDFEIYHNEKYDIRLLYSLKVDSLDNVWVLANGDLYRINQDNDECVRYSVEDYASFSHIFVSSKGTVWILAYDGNIYQWNSSDDTLLPYPVLDDEDWAEGANLACIDECSDGKLMICTSNHGAKLFSPVNKHVEKLFTDADGHQLYVHCVIRHGGDEFWIGAEDGIWIYKLNHGFVNHISKDYKSLYSLTDNAVHVMLNDREGGVWVGTFFGGLNYLPANDFQFNKHYPRGDDGTISANVVREIIRKDANTLFVGTEDGGLYTFDTHTHDFRPLSPLVNNGKRISNNIQSILAVDDQLWIATLNEGIYVSDFNGHIVRHYENVGVPDKLFRNSRGDIFVGTMHCLLCYDKLTDDFYLVDGMDNLFIHTIIENSDNDLLVGTLTNGLYRVTYSGNVYKGECVGFQKEEISFLYEDSHHTLWVGSNNNGLHTYNIGTKIATDANITLCHDGLSICSITEDDLGHLWISTSTGLFCYDVQKDYVGRYNLSSMLSSPHFNYNSTYTDHDGIIYLGTVDGMVSFNPMYVAQTDRDLTVYFTDYTSDHTSFSIYFSVPTYSMEQALWYRYRLLGVDKEWNVAQEQHVIRYNNLSAGHYTLEVEAGLENGMWSGTISEYSIDIVAPWYLTLWAKFIYFAIAAAVVCFLYQVVRKRRTERRKAMIEKQRNEQYRELTQEKMRFFTAITHEIRTPLTLLLTPIESLIKSFSEERAKQLLPIMQRNGNELLNLINQILDFRKLEQGRSKLELSRGDVMEYIRSASSPFKAVANKKHIQFGVETEGELYMFFDTDKMQRILYNLLGNAFKFTPEGGWVKVVAKKSSDSYLSISVSDSGVGISDEDKEHIFDLFYQCEKNKEAGLENEISVGSGIGLHLVKEFVEMHYGSITVDSKVGEGSSFHISLPVNLKENRIPTVMSASSDDDSSNDETENVVSNGVSRSTLLLVDDNEEFLQYLNYELRDDYQILLAHNGQEAYEMAQANDINIIVSDVMMPEMNGNDLCRNIKSNIKTSHILVILLTAKVGEEYKLNGYKSGADYYIAKPFNVEILKNRIVHLCQQQRERYNMFLQDLNVTGTQLTSSQLDEEIYNKAVALVVDNMDNTEYSVEQFSSDMCMSRMTLYRKLVSITGRTPHEFMNTIRLKKAALLLKQTKYGIAEIADLVGYGTQRNFTKSFKEFYGVTPQEYRNS